jgi:Dynamin family
MNPEEVARVCEAIAAAVEQSGDPHTRDAAAAAIRETVERTTAGVAEVFVVGEKKAGKSSLINALAEWPDLLPVDADVATNVYIVVGHLDQPEAFAYLTNTDEPVAIGLDQIATYAALDPVTGKAFRDDVRHVTAGILSPLLASGLSLVDTPGVGGLLAGHTHLTRAMLREADALVFVTSAAGELTKSALDFLADATARIATVFFVLAQIDISPGWQQVLERNRKLVTEHAPRYASAPWFPVSNRAEIEALTAVRSGDDELARSRREVSGCASLRETLTSRVAEHGLDLRMRNALQVARIEADALVTGWEYRIRLLSLDPGLTAELEARWTLLKQLVADDAQWRAELAKGLRAFDRELRLSLQRSMNEIREMAETKIAISTEAGELDQIPADLEAAIAGAALDLDLNAREAVRKILAAVRDKIGQTDARLGLPGKLRRMPPLVPTAHDADGFAAAVERAAPALGLGMLAGSAVAAITSSVLLPVLAGVGAMTMLSRRRKHREALLRGRADATRYLSRALSEMNTEYSAEIGALTEDVGNRLSAAITAYVDQQRHDLEDEIAAQQSYLRATEAQLAQDRAEAQQQVDAFHALVDAVDRLGKD